jgi:hypothetical protein
VSLFLKYQDQEIFLIMNPENERPSISESIKKDISDLSPVQSNKPDIQSINPNQSASLPDRQETTRAWLATFLTYTLAGTITTSFILIISLVVMSGFIVDEKKTNSFDKTSALAKDLITFILTAQTGLIGTALGFYFGSKGNN